MLYIEIIKVMDLDVLPNAQCTQFHGKWAEKDRNFGVTLMIEPVFMRATREGVKIMVVIIGFIFSGCSNLNMTYSPILLQELGMPTGAVGTVLFFSTIVELPVILFSYKFMDRFSGRTLMLLAFAIMVTQFLLYATAPNAFVAVVTMLVLRAIGSTLFGMILLKIVRGVVQVRSVSTALGVISATDAMSAILMQNLGGILVENTSIRILYFAMAGLMMLGMILTLFLRVQNTEKVFS